MKKVIFSLICFMVGLLPAIAGDHPEAHFGEFGLDHFPTAEGYQQYVGQVVEYLPQTKPSYDDKKFIELFKGKFNTPYVIQKVSGNDKKIKFEMVEKDNPKAKIKFEFLNYPEYYSYGKNTFANTEEYRVPLFFPDKFEAAKSSYTNKQLKAQGDTYLTIRSIQMSSSANEEDGYPVLCYEAFNPLTNTTTLIPESSSNTFTDIIGTVYTDPECNFSYTVADLNISKPYSSTTEYEYSLKNSATGQIEKTKVTKGSYGYSSGLTPKGYAESRFANAKSGHYLATLSKVEKPSNSAIRYGKTTEIKDTDKDITKFSYIDNVIDIIIFATNKEFSFELKNISPNSIKIIWDEAAFVDAEGSTSKVMHVGTKYADRNGSQPATTVIKNAKIEDVATPTDRVYYSDALKEWTSKTMMPTTPKQKGKQLRLMLPIQIKDVVNEYVFVFDLNYVLNHPELLVNPEF